MIQNGTKINSSDLKKKTVIQSYKYYENMTLLEWYET